MIEEIEQFYMNLPYSSVNLRKFFSYTSNSLVEDYSDFEYVDGEEGDFGVIRYSNKEGELFAIKTVHGGDAEDVDFTDFGKKYILTEIIKSLQETLKELT